MTGNCRNCGQPTAPDRRFCAMGRCPACHGNTADCEACGGTGAAPADLVAVRRCAAELAGLFTQRQVIAEAELAARGIQPVSIAHGDPETHNEVELVFTTVPALARRCGQVLLTRSGNDYATYLFHGRDAEQAAVDFIAQVQAIAPRWWRVTPTGNPVWR